MKQWLRKLFEQFDDQPQRRAGEQKNIDINEDRATVLYMLDIYNKHLYEIDGHSIRKTRDALDDFLKGLIDPESQNAEKLLFRIRQFFSTYRIDEYTYIQKTFDDFKNIIWDFADQLCEDMRFEQEKDAQVKQNLDQLREAVEANSIVELRSKSRELIDFYVQYQMEKDEMRTKSMTSIQKNLDTVKKRLTEANTKMHTDHLTGAHNRMSFDEQVKNQYRLFGLTKAPVTILSVDIDFFKKINDTFGHDVGDFVLKECVRLMKSLFNKTDQVVARVGGEEFAIILPGLKLEDAVKKAEELLAQVRKEVIVHHDFQVKYTMSAGVAQLLPNEPTEKWLKRADEALYKSKQTGRNRVTVAPHNSKGMKVA